MLLFRKPGIVQRIRSFCESMGEDIVNCPTFRKVTIGTVRMWFKRTQTALESDGIPAGTEILNDLKKIFKDLKVEGLFASLHHNPNMAAGQHCKCVTICQIKIIYRCAD